MKKPPVVATLQWQGDLRFSARTPRASITLDSDSADGPSPPEALAIALAGCMAIDVTDVVLKGRHELRGLEAGIVGERVETPPHRFHRFTLRFTVTGGVPPAAVERGIGLSREKYCSVWHSLRPDIDLLISFEVLP
jgi:putative redox protein